jgi:Flp pilus assembly pilin Flp
MTVNDIMVCPDQLHINPLKKKLLSAVSRPDRGAVTVEYALCMVLAAVLMLGVEVMFSTMAQQIISRFKNIVLSFPNI